MSHGERDTVITECQNCGAAVSHDYVRVFGVDGRVLVCPDCTDRIRRDGKPQEASHIGQAGTDHHKRGGTAE